MSARVSLASASGFSSLPRPPSRARRGSSVPPPVSVIDQVLQALLQQCCIMSQRYLLTFMIHTDRCSWTSWQRRLASSTWGNGLFRAGSGLVVHCFEWCWDWWSTQRANHRNKDHQDGQINRFGPRRLMAGVRSWEGGHILEFICRHYIQAIRICIKV